MNHESMQAYGLWGLVIINSAVFIFFALSFFKPKTRTDWRSFGAFSAFLVALFAEMYGFPLTIYLLSGWLQSRFPQVDWLSHDAGHLLEMMFGWEAKPNSGNSGDNTPRAHPDLFPTGVRRQSPTTRRISETAEPSRSGSALILHLRQRRTNN